MKRLPTQLKGRKQSGLAKGYYDDGGSEYSHILNRSLKSEKDLPSRQNDAEMSVYDSDSDSFEDNGHENDSDDAQSVSSEESAEADAKLSRPCDGSFETTVVAEASLFKKPHL